MRFGRGIAVGTLLAMLFLQACAYGFSKGRVREDLRNVAIPFFENRSTEPGVEVELTEAIVAGITADRTLKVVDENAADAIVDGVLKTYAFEEAFLGRDQLVEEFKVRIVCEITMRDRRTQEPIVGPSTVHGEGSYLISDGPEGERIARGIATEEIIEKILNLVVEPW